MSAFTASSKHASCPHEIVKNKRNKRNLTSPIASHKRSSAIDPHSGSHSRSLFKSSHLRIYSLALLFRVPLKSGPQKGPPGVCYNNIYSCICCEFESCWLQVCEITGLQSNQQKFKNQTPASEGPGRTTQPRGPKSSTGGPNVPESSAVSTFAQATSNRTNASNN